MPAPARPRLIVLGASNVVLGLPELLDAARRRLGAPHDLLAAFGFGRSYGLSSNVLGRRLPGILQCGLWDALRADGPAAALVTDVGNDLVYGADVDTIVAWVAEALERLRAAGAQAVLNGLPLPPLERLSRWRFLCLRTAFYPKSPLSHERLGRDAPALHERLRALARERGLPFFEPRAEWYGLDPIHVRRRCRTPAWERLLSELPAAAADAPPPLRGAGRLRLLAPERRAFLGFEQRRAQPAGRLPDGSTLSFY